MDSGINRASRSRKSSWRTHSDVVALRSQSQLSCEQHLENFIAKARSENSLNVSDFEANYWPVAKRARGSSAGEGGVHFTLEPARKGTSLPPFPEPFLSFMKAVVSAYDARTVNGYAASQLQTLVAAGRWLYRQFGVRDPNPCELTHGDFESAVRAAEGVMGEGVANIGSKLAIISGMLDEKGIGYSPISWRNPIKRNKKHNFIGPVADRRREELMPSDEVLNALSQISSNPDLDVRDLIIQRTIDLLVSCGFRINEVLTMPRDCLHIEHEEDEFGQPVMNRFGKAVERIGLRHWPEKGSTETRMKWVPPVMNDIVKRAIAEISEITEESWRVAQYQFEHAGDTLLPEPWNSMAPDTMVTTGEVEEMLELAEGGGNQWLRENDVPRVSVPMMKSDGTAAQRSFYKAEIRNIRTALYNKSERGDVLRRAEGSQLLHNCLFIIPKFFIKRSSKFGTPGTVSLLKDANVNVYLVGFKETASIFERLNCVGADGVVLRATSHAFRHWLSTLVLEGGMNDVELARWMGRKAVAQNEAYDHRSPVQRAKRLGDKMRAGEAAGPIAEVTFAIRDPVRREEFTGSMHGTAHVTDLGGCVHPWDALPCEKHGSCSDCSELRLTKGDRRGRENAADQLTKTSAELALAQVEQEDGSVIAGRWIDAHTRTLDALERIIAVHADPSIPDGTIVQLPNKTRRDN